MTPRRAMILAWCGVAACAVGLWLTGCTDPGPRAWVRWYGEPPTAETWDRVNRALPHMPAEPWGCVTAITISDSPACPAGMATCYWPDMGSIRTTQAGLGHELMHAALDCATGSPDHAHTHPAWREVDRP